MIEYVLIILLASIIVAAFTALVFLMGEIVKSRQQTKAQIQATYAEIQHSHAEVQQAADRVRQRAQAVRDSIRDGRSPVSEEKVASIHKRFSQDPAEVG